MNSVADPLFANTADALRLVANGLDRLLMQACATLQIHKDVYGNVFFKKPGASLERSVMLGFSDDSVDIALAMMMHLTRPCLRPIELVYMPTQALHTPELEQLPIRSNTPAHTFIALCANPPIEQHLKARWYQLNCCATNVQGSSMALSHNAIVLAFHSMQRIQSVANTLAESNALQLSFSRIHPLPDAEQVTVHVAVKHQDAAVLDTFDQMLSRQLLSQSRLHTLLAPTPYPHSALFASSLQKTCQHLATRSYALSTISLNDAMYLASAGPHALITQGLHAEQSAEALANLLIQLAH